MAISDGVLWVADIAVVRRFDAKTGQPLGEVKIEGASFLNDVAPAADGGIIVSDSGLTAKFESSGTDAIYLVDRKGGVRSLARSEALGRPNGVHATPDGGAWVVTFGTGELYEVTARGERKGSVKLPTGQLDGIVIPEDGDLLISSWQGETIDRGRPGTTWTQVVTGVKSPGDIGWDAKRRRLLIPLLRENALQIQRIP